MESCDGLGGPVYIILIIIIHIKKGPASNGTPISRIA